MHRAILLFRPTTELSGKYKCKVSTYLDEDEDHRDMIIFEYFLCPPRPDQYVVDDDDCEVISDGNFIKYRPLPTERVRRAIHLPEYHNLKNADMPPIWLLNEDEVLDEKKNSFDTPKTGGDGSGAEHEVPKQHFPPEIKLEKILIRSRKF
ncbi:hypothetical protein QYM36_011141 [Artemia franciscana]|uniref:Uncharacterized protein n=1 Tax=Artemia franciscana TaxID=6661 RepID=A0AA88HUK5_ARTSF|nr:hypothetical protein QYM36_011141 [Artemia franciscana]